MPSRRPPVITLVARQKTNCMKSLIKHYYLERQQHVSGAYSYLVRMKNLTDSRASRMAQETFREQRPISGKCCLTTVTPDIGRLGHASYAIINASDEELICMVWENCVFKDMWRAASLESKHTPRSEWLYRSWTAQSRLRDKSRTFTFTA